VQRREKVDKFKKPAIKAFTGTHDKMRIFEKKKKLLKTFSF